jgi:UDP-glucose 4-epimerase
MATYIGEVLGREPKMILKPSRVGEVTHYVADISKANKVLGYKPQISLRDGIEKAINWSQDWTKK